MRRFNPDKELYKIQHGNRNRILYGIILILLIISIGSTYALYQVRYSKRIIYTIIKVPKKYSITTEVIGNGSVSPIEQNIKEGEDSDYFDLTPAAGYIVNNISCNNNQKITQEVNRFKVNSLTSDTKCTITFVSEKYTITASISGSGGSVSPSSQTVSRGEDSGYFSVSLSTGYKISSISCTNSQTVSQSGNSFKVTNVTNDSHCTITIKVDTKTFSDIIVANNSTIYADGTAQNNIRYVGNSPSNYIWFNCDNYSGTMNETNCEKWRIIGLFKNVTKAAGGTEDLVKIIRADSIGNIAWDGSATGTGGYNNWARPADLNTKLNDTYYNGTAVSDSKKGITNATKNMIEQVKWNVGGHNSQNSTASQFYESERGSTCPGYIGLMNVSDYGYAADKSCWETNVFRYGNNSYTCYNSDWLYITDTYQWTLTPLSSNSTSVFSVLQYGNVSYKNTYRTDTVRPTLYLKSSVKVKSGTENGSSTTPYVLVP